MAISTIGTDALASAAVTSAKLASGAPSRSQLPAGTVLQVVTGTTTSATTTSSTSYVTTSLTATITPTSATSKIFVIVSGQLYTAGNGQDMYIGAYRNGSLELNAFMKAQAGSSGGLVNAIYTSSYLSSPSSTSAQTYTPYIKSGGAYNVSFNVDSFLATITLMEIAV